MTQIQALETMSQTDLVKLIQTERKQHADDMDMLAKELAERPHAKIDRPMAIGCGRFGIGVKTSTVLDAAARHYDFVTNEKREQDRIELGKLKADNFLQYGAPTDLEAYKAWLEKVNNSTPATPAALRYAAKVIELYDDATMRADYMLSSTDCADILEALAEYFTVHPRTSVDKTPEMQAFQVDETDKMQDSLVTKPFTGCTCPSGNGSLRWPCPVHPPESVNLTKSSNQQVEPRIIIQSLSMAIKLIAKAAKSDGLQLASRTHHKVNDALSLLERYELLGSPLRTNEE